MRMYEVLFACPDQLTKELSKFERLQEDIQNKLCSPYVPVLRDDYIEILELYKAGGKTAIKLAVTFDPTFKATIHVHRKKLPQDHDLWDGLPQSFDTYSKVQLLLDRLNKYVVCIGNPDEEYQDLVPVGTALTSGNSSEVHAYREGDFGAELGKVTYSSTIRAMNCPMLVEGPRCCSCASYRRCLRTRKQRLAEKDNLLDIDLIHSRYKHKDMSRQMLISKINQQKSCIKSMQHQIDKQRRDIDREILRSGISIPDHQNQEMSDLFSVCREDMEKAFPDPNSLQILLWEQQMKFSRSGKNGMRWHPMIIKWCLYLRHKSSKAYDVLRDSGFIILPSARTLFDYSHYTASALGFQGDVVQMLQEEASKKEMFSKEEPYKCYVGILFDEIRIKEDLVYDKHTGELVGYCNLDKVGNQILQLQKLSDNEGSVTAKNMLVLMVRGVSTDLKFPLAGFATLSITADFLYPIIWKAIDIVEIINLKVLFLTCDGASSNRKIFDMHKVSEDQVLVYSTVNPRDKSRKIFFISDVPHLMKTTRNCFSNSNAHKNTRKLWKDGKDISWLHILKLYEEHCELSLYSPCPKLTRAHVDMTAFGCMKVNLAAQVLSSSVGNALEELYGDSVNETVAFIRNFNKFFDCLNVRR
ncbi:LOW QUALITY PROTEIN: uncharacterized protein LOC117319517 [Pecten maximus]|uniref:LOW QUALITY PROTEIN: uncharacterized protein LOC117319517 n=1 Tax=Pecten maximus TaxID=6579 RepID=UPI0014582BB8|nr:LOW QUALITY PROTEIN: uncharacterized protein LOC117319517 [Pecten maximus]